jgi:hypothetical protein
MSMNDEPKLGPCCICETTEGVHAIIMLNQRAPVPGHGWGCVQCDLPWDGAVAVLCDPCCEGYQAGTTALRFACRGYPATDGRIPIDKLPPPDFDHDHAKHQGEMSV